MNYSSFCTCILMYPWALVVVDMYYDVFCVMYGRI